MATASMRQKLTFEPNVHQTITMSRYTTGREIEGRDGKTDYLYWLEGNLSMFAPAELHNAIQAYNPQQGDTFEVTKRTKGKSHTWEVIQTNADEPKVEEPAPKQATRPSSPAPAEAAPIPQQQPRTAGTLTRSTLDLVACFCAAIDALVEAKAYGERKGLNLRWDSGDVRAVAISAYIGCQKGSC